MKGENIMKKLPMIILFFMLSLSPTFADEWISVGDVASSYDTSTEELDDIEPIFTEEDSLFKGKHYDYAGTDNLLPKVETEQIVEHIKRKGFEIINILQELIQPIAIIFFMLGAIMMLFGSFARGDLAGKGFYTMFMSGVSYALVLYAPIIVPAFAGWIVG